MASLGLSELRQVPVVGPNWEIFDIVRIELIFWGRNKIANFLYMPQI